MTGNVGVIWFLVLLIVVLGFLLLGNGAPKIRIPGKTKRRDAYEAGRVITVMDEKGRKHKAVLLPEEKPKETPSKKVSWRYKQP